MSRCTNLMCSNDIFNKHDFRKWAVKGGHPDKGGSTARFQNVLNCIHKELYCKKRPSKRKKRPSAKRPSAKKPSPKKPSPKKPSAKRPSAKKPSCGNRKTFVGPQGGTYYKTWYGKVYCDPKRKEKPSPKRKKKPSPKRKKKPSCGNRKTFVGPRGGVYYKTKSGRKVYCQK